MLALESRQGEFVHACVTACAKTSAIPGHSHHLRELPLSPRTTWLSTSDNRREWATQSRFWRLTPRSGISRENIKVFGCDNTKVTAWGECPAIMTNVLFLNPSISRMVSPNLELFLHLTYNASIEESVGQSLVAATSGCNSSVGTQATLDDLRNYQRSFRFASRSTFPSLDPMTFATLPFILSANSKRSYIAANFTPPAILNRVFDLFLQLYADDPIVVPIWYWQPNIWTITRLQETECHICALQTTQTAMRAGVKAYGTSLRNTCQQVGYLWRIWSEFLIHRSDTNQMHKFTRMLSGMFHEAVSSNVSSKMMIDYWMLFSTSLNPSDDLGILYTPENKVLLQLNGGSMTIIPDDYRKEQINFLRNIAVIFHNGDTGETGECPLTSDETRLRIPLSHTKSYPWEADFFKQNQSYSAVWFCEVIKKWKWSIQKTLVLVRMIQWQVVAEALALDQLPGLLQNRRALHYNEISPIDHRAMKLEMIGSYSHHPTPSSRTRYGTNSIGTAEDRIGVAEPTQSLRHCDPRHSREKSGRDRTCDMKTLRGIFARRSKDERRLDEG
ncbi:hypothetical protein EDD18DRAFT_1106747 [Armillaria luteobubalina]|uniref:Uncharacterized protein n=1 Tax=Armillaria luteobubalina TaxID=153913 RepID=A0AA39Q3E7_9AGAR|nr:hypothetical protein EDD18DRAFT_1106747 [Armillaria luteobubalina]